MTVDFRLSWKVGKSTGDRACLFDSERFKRKFVTTLADPRGELDFRIDGDDAKTLSREPACSAGPAVRPCGSSSDAGSSRVANGTIRFKLGPAPNTASDNIFPAVRLAAALQTK